MSTHIGAKPGEIAEAILLPGDPLRAKFIAETYLENPVCYNEIRGMYGFTGTYKGKKVSVQGTGMGQPSLSIYVNELVRFYGVQKAFRVGTAGDRLAVAVSVHDCRVEVPEPITKGSMVDLFGLDAAGEMGQVFLLPASSGGPARATGAPALRAAGRASGSRRSSSGPGGRWGCRVRACAGPSSSRRE